MVWRSNQRQCQQQKARHSREKKVWVQGEEKSRFSQQGARNQSESMMMDHGRTMQPVQPPTEVDSSQIVFAAFVVEKTARDDDGCLLVLTALIAVERHLKGQTQLAGKNTRLEAR